LIIAEIREVKASHNIFFIFYNYFIFCNISLRPQDLPQLWTFP
jgi:hypothetical protein